MCERCRKGAYLLRVRILADFGRVHGADRKIRKFAIRVVDDLMCRFRPPVGQQMTSPRGLPVSRCRAQRARSPDDEKHLLFPPMAVNGQDRFPVEQHHRNSRDPLRLAAPDASGRESQVAARLAQPDLHWRVGKWRHRFEIVNISQLNSNIREGPTASSAGRLARAAARRKGSRLFL